MTCSDALLIVAVVGGRQGKRTRETSLYVDIVERDSLLLAPPSPAAVISRDWKTPGDGLLTYDTVNKREWLDLTESRLVMFAGSTLEQRYQNGLLQLLPGGELEGFIGAQGLDLIALSQSAGIDTSSSSFSLNHSPIENLIALVGASIGPTDDGTVAAFGALDEISGPTEVTPNTRLSGRLFSIPTSGQLGLSQLIIGPGYGDGATLENTGMWLYRNVPEPNGMTLGIIGALLLKLVTVAPLTSHVYSLN